MAPEPRHPDRAAGCPLRHRIGTGRRFFSSYGFIGRAGGISVSVRFEPGVGSTPDRKLLDNGAGSGQEQDSGGGGPGARCVSRLEPRVLGAPSQGGNSTRSTATISSLRRAPNSRLIYPYNSVASLTKRRHGFGRTIRVNNGH